MRYARFQVQGFVCILIFGCALFLSIERQNELIALRREIPKVRQELKELRESNTQLHYEVDRFESPMHLRELLRKPEFSHLKFPKLDQEILLMREKVVAP